MFHISKKDIKSLSVADWENIIFAVGLYVEDAMYTMPSKSPEWDIWSDLRDKLDKIVVAQQHQAIE